MHQNIEYTLSQKIDLNKTKDLQASLAEILTKVANVEIEPNKIKLLSVEKTGYDHASFQLRIDGKIKDQTTDLKVGKLKMPKKLLEKLKQDQKANNYKEIETMIIEALDNYYDF